MTRPTVTPVGPEHLGAWVRWRAYVEREGTTEARVVVDQLEREFGQEGAARLFFAGPAWEVDANGRHIRARQPGRRLARRPRERDLWGVLQGAAVDDWDAPDGLTRCEILAFREGRQ